MNKKMLIIEDEQGLQLTLDDIFTADGFDTMVVGDGINGEKEAIDGSWDIILLDVMLPGKDGFEICKAIRKKRLTTPILMLTARNLVMDRIMGLDFGADDYLMKPFDLKELMARVNALLRRGQYNKEDLKPQKAYFGEFNLDLSLVQLTKGKVKIPLNTREFLLLQYLCTHPNRVINRNELLNQVWGYDSVATTRTVDVHVGWLRKKLGEQAENRHIITVRGLGYRFSN